MLLLGFGSVVPAFTASNDQKGKSQLVPDQGYMVDEAMLSLGGIPGNLKCAWQCVPEHCCDEV